nr:RecName: Full=Unknown protein 3 from 2D-PAGE [Fructilactobacillus sanfranciscensis]
SLGSGGSL